MHPGCASMHVLHPYCNGHGMHALELPALPAIHSCRQGALLKGLHVALPLCSLVMSMMSPGMLRLIMGQHDDCPDERQELEQDPQGGQEEGYAAQGLHLG